MAAPKALKSYNGTGRFAILNSPYYILQFPFLFRYVYTLHIISLNNSFYCNYLLEIDGKAIDRKGSELLTNACIADIMFSI